jgi:hypothetical protein
MNIESGDIDHFVKNVIYQTLNNYEGERLIRFISNDMACFCNIYNVGLVEVLDAIDGEFSGMKQTIKEAMGLR